jgi:hypothetical protein
MSKNPTPVDHQAAAPGQDFDRQVSGLLQSMYGAVESEGIPEKFLDLLEKLDRAERAQTKLKDS